MKIKLNFKPFITTHTSKPYPNRLFSTKLRFGSNSEGVSWGHFDDTYAYGFVYHKVRKKVKSQKRVTKIHNGITVKTTKRTYEPAKWVVSYYKIPFAVLKAANLDLKQKSRHFELKPKSR